MSDPVDRLRERWRRTLTVLRAPRVRIEASGSDEARAAYLTLTSRHPRFKLIPYKRWGVALVRLPMAYDEYLAGHAKWVLRLKLRTAAKHKYCYSLVSPESHLEDILEINRSAPSRQGRAMSASYLDREQVLRTFEGHAAIHGVLDVDGRLRAYATVFELGDATVITLILGHADDLEYGTMYLLVSEVVRACVDSRSANGSPRWLMYDTYWGASQGLAFFKERLGFQPYTVDWLWIDRVPE